MMSLCCLRGGSLHYRFQDGNTHGLAFCFKIKLCKKSRTKSELKTSEHRKTLTSFCCPLLPALPGSCCQQLSESSLRSPGTAANILCLQRRL